MGLKVGLDFGTTTSILSYMQGLKPQTFHYGGYTENSTPYVPSLVAYLDDDLLIGPYATERLRKRSSLYRYFKMLLPELNKEKWVDSYGPYASETLAPAQVTADFLGELLTGDSPGRKRLSLPIAKDSAFLQVQNERIDELVVSVPQVWSHWQAEGRQQLQKVVSSLGLRLKQLISEPVAAAAYFAHRYKEQQEEPFFGNLLICDMGGGTFDVTLCKLSENKVEVLCNAGNGESGLGIAGAHFDHALLSQKVDSSQEPTIISQLLNELDRQKKSRDSYNQLLSCLQRPEETPLEPIYMIGSPFQSYLFSFAEIEEAFSSVREGIFEVLNSIKREAQVNNYSIQKVVMVGGFSRFPLVQQAIAEAFNEDLFDTRLIDLDTFTRDDMAFAIAHGACLLANELVQISEKYDHTISAMTYNSSGPADEEELRLINAGMSLDTLEATNYCRWPSGERRRFKFQRESAEVNILIRRDGSFAEEQKISRRCSLTEIPGSGLANNYWYLGARVDASKIPYLVLQDEKLQVEKSFPLGDLIRARAES